MKKPSKAKREITFGSIFRLFMSSRKTKIAVGITCAIVIIFVVTPLVWRYCELKGLPKNDEHIPGIAVTHIIEIPPRPGIQGIVITGPIIVPLWFAIDLGVAPTALDWGNLKTTDPGADVKIRARIKGGKIEFDREKGDIKDTGHPRASSIIERAMRTWGYKRYKEGEIRFWFHLGAEGEKLIIDLHGLRPTKDYENRPVKDGLVYYINGIRKGEAKIERVRF